MWSFHVQIRQMVRKDIPAGMDLVRAAGFNQTGADWERFLDADVGRCFIAEYGHEVCGTTATISYGNQLVWIGMVLVSPSPRCQGIGTELVKSALEHLDLYGPPAIMLDATRRGMPIYLRFRFKAEYEIERWVLHRTPSLPASRPLSRGDEEELCFDDIAALDREVFEADRRSLLRSLHRDAPEFSLAIWNEATLEGYAFGRHGLHSDQLSPWVARDEAAAVPFNSQLPRCG